MNRARTSLAAALALTLPLALVPLAGCGGTGEAQASSDPSGNDAAADKKAEDGKEKKEEAVPVELAAIERGAIEAVLRFSTNLEAESHVAVFSEANRKVVELRVEEGNRVRKGDVLLRLQDDAQQSDVAKARVELDQAEREYARQQRLHAEKLISEQVFNDATYRLQQLRLKLADAERELGYTEVRAPIAGTVTQRLVKLGDQVQIGQHLFDIVDFESIVARVYVPEKHLRDLAPGLAARVSSPSLGGSEFAGRVDRIAPVVDPKTGTVKVTVALGGQPGLRPGLYVDVDLVTAVHRDAVLVPKRALVYDNDLMFVFRLKDGNRAERIALDPVLEDKLNVEPAGGLAPGDRIVVAGQTGLKDGALVKDVDAEPEAEPQPSDRASL